MKLAIMQPYFFPYLGYFQLICAVDLYVLHAGLSYIKQGWVNRNRILGPVGSPSWINAQIAERSSHRSISEVKLVSSPHWKNKLLRTLCYNYRKSPFFPETYALVESVVTPPTERLGELNRRSIEAICRFLDIRTPIEWAEARYPELERQLSGVEDGTPTTMPRKVARILEICRLEGATDFVNAIGGRTLYDKDEFRRNGVDVFFLETQPYEYPQRGGPFVADLSIIDVLMNCGRAGSRELLERYRLV